MARVTTFTQSPDTVLPAELNNIQDDYEQLFKQRFFLQYGHTKDFQLITSPSTGPTFLVGRLLSPNYVSTVDVGTFNTIARRTSGAGISTIFRWDPVEWLAVAGTRAIKLALRSTVVATGTTAFGVTIGVGLRAVLNNSGNIGELYHQLDTADLASPRNVHSAPAAASTNTLVSELADASTLAAGRYGILASTAGGHNSSSNINIFADLSVKLE